MKKITKEDQLTLKEKFPKFGKIQACMCNNPEYGVTLSPAAKRWLNHGKTGQKQRSKSKVISVRVDVDEVEKLKSMGVQITDLIKEAIKEKITDDD